MTAAEEAKPASFHLPDIVMFCLRNTAFSCPALVLICLCPSFWLLLAFFDLLCNTSSQFWHWSCLHNEEALYSLVHRFMIHPREFMVPSTPTCSCSVLTIPWAVQTILTLTSAPCDTPPCVTLVRLVHLRCGPYAWSLQWWLRIRLVYLRCGPHVWSSQWWLRTMVVSAASASAAVPLLIAPLPVSGPASSRCMTLPALPPPLPPLLLGLLLGSNASSLARCQFLVAHPRSQNILPALVMMLTCSPIMAGTSLAWARSSRGSFASGSTLVAGRRPRALELHGWSCTSST